jgi:hypothetical protein
MRKAEGEMWNEWGRRKAEFRSPHSPFNTQGMKIFRKGIPHSSFPIQEPDE